MPVTWAPSRAIGSQISPPPQPISSSDRPCRGCPTADRAAKWAAARSRMKPRRTGLSRCSGANLPRGSHHSSAMRAKRSTSAGSTVEAARNMRRIRPCVALDPRWRPRCLYPAFEQVHGAHRSQIRRHFGRRHSIASRTWRARSKPRSMRGNEVAVVVSAMSGATNQLVKWVDEIAPLHRCARIRRRGRDRRAGDDRPAGDGAAAARRERALLAVGWQMPINTDAAHGQGAHPGDRTAEHGPPHGGRRGADRAGLPGRVARGPHHHAGPRRLGHLGGGAGGGAQGASAATSTPTSTASTRPIRGSSRRRRRSTR